LPADGIVAVTVVRPVSFEAFVHLILVHLVCVCRHHAVIQPSVLRFLEESIAVSVVCDARRLPPFRKLVADGRLKAKVLPLVQVIGVVELEIALGLPVVLGVASVGPLGKFPLSVSGLCLEALAVQVLGVGELLPDAAHF
jgi:hypothetical protein